MHTVRWGILGPGKIAERFAVDLPNSRTAKLVAVASREAERAETFAAKHGAERWFGSYEELLADDSIDAVYIATPHPLHAQWAIRAAEAGKHMLCEKPITVNSAEAMAVIEAARAHDVFLMEAFMYRSQPQTKKLVELIRSGAIGTIHQIQASFAFGSSGDPTNRLFRQDLAGGGILDVGCYPISMVRLLAGAARGKDFAEPDDIDGVAYLGPENRIDEWATATLRFAGGDAPITAHVSTGVRLSTDRTMRVFGSDGYLVVPSPWGPGPGNASIIEVHRRGADAPEVIEIASEATFGLEADTVAAHVDERQAPEMSWADSLGNMETLDRWRAAIGLEYDFERLDANIPPVHGRRVTAKDDHRMQYGEVPGVAKKISRLVMGGASRGSLSYASVMFDDFVERGGNCFDTAYIYGGGMAERLLGQWMHNRGNREDIVVIGKGAHSPHCDPESLTRQMYESLERLQTDYIDVYFMHRDNLDIPVGEFVDVLDEHQRAGRIHTFGGSNWTIERIVEANAYAEANNKLGFVALSNNFSLARMVEPPWAGCLAASEDETRRWFEKNQVPLMPWSSQARGFFTGRSNPDDTKSDPELARCWYSADNFTRKERAQSLASQRGVSAVAIALAYVLAQDFPTFPLIGPHQLSETHDSFAALDIGLTPEETRWLDLRD